MLRPALAHYVFSGVFAGPGPEAVMHFIRSGSLKVLVLHPFIQHGNGTGVPPAKVRATSATLWPAWAE